VVANMTHTQEGKSSVFGLSIGHIDDDACVKHFHFVSNITPDHYCSSIELEAPISTKLAFAPSNMLSDIIISENHKVIEPYRIKEIMLILKTLEKEAVNEYVSDDEFRAHALVELQEMLALLGQ